MPANPAFRPRRSMNFARRQQYRRLMRAAMASTACAAVAMLGLLAAGAGAVILAGLLLLAAGALAIRVRRWLALAGRSRVGAHSEDEVQRALARLEADGWRLRHSLPWRGRGDIDSVAIAPTGVAFAIETKTKTLEDRHVARVLEQAEWLSRRRRRWCKRGALPVVCLARRRGVEHVEAGVLVVSIDRLTLPSAPSPGCEIVRASSGDIARLPRLNLLRARTPRHPRRALSCVSSTAAPMSVCAEDATQRGEVCSIANHPTCSELRAPTLAQGDRGDSCVTRGSAAPLTRRRSSGPTGAGERSRGKAIARRRTVG